MVTRPNWGDNVSQQPQGDERGSYDYRPQSPQTYTPEYSQYPSNPATPYSYNSSQPPLGPASSSDQRQFGAAPGQQYDRQQYPPREDYSRQYQQPSHGTNEDYYNAIPYRTAANPQSYHSAAPQGYNQGSPPNYNQGTAQGYNQSASHDYNQPPPQSHNPSDPRSYHQSAEYGNSGPGGQYPDYNPYSSSGNPLSRYDQQSSNSQVGTYGNYSQPPPADADKGVAGALTGAALGAYGGHKVHHGFIGAIAGGVVGSKLQDHMKADKKKKKENKPGHGRKDSSSSSSSSSSNSSSHHHGKHQYFAGNFSASCTQITLDGDYDLISLCTAVDGSKKLSSISLNGCLTNEWGQLRWAKGGNFGASSRDVRLVDGGKVLEAAVGDGAGGWKHNRIALDERISNNNGELVFLG